MAGSSHHQQGVHSSQMGLPNGAMHPQQGIHRMQEGMVQYQSGQVSQSNMAPQQPGHCSSNGAAAGAHQSVQGCSSSFQHQEAGVSPLHGDFHVKSLIVPICECISFLLHVL